MKYKVTNLKGENTTWSGVLESWEGCYCSRTFKEFSFESDTRPTKEQIITYVANS